MDYQEDQDKKWKKYTEKQDLLLFALYQEKGYHKAMLEVIDFMGEQFKGMQVRGSVRLRREAEELREEIDYLSDSKVYDYQKAEYVALDRKLDESFKTEKQHAENS